MFLCTQISQWWLQASSVRNFHCFTETPPPQSYLYNLYNLDLSVPEQRLQLQDPMHVNFILGEIELGLHLDCQYISNAAVFNEE